MVGFTSWSAVQNKGAPFLHIAVTDWLTLTPVVTLCVGLIPLIVSSLVKRTQYDTRVAVGN